MLSVSFVLHGNCTVLSKAFYLTPCNHFRSFGTVYRYIIFEHLLLTRKLYLLFYSSTAQYFQDDEVEVLAFSSCGYGMLLQKSYSRDNLGLIDIFGRIISRWILNPSVQWLSGHILWNVVNWKSNPQKLALTSPTRGDQYSSTRTQATEFSFSRKPLFLHSI
jgi:hypothetical protein